MAREVKKKSIASFKRYTPVRKPDRLDRPSLLSVFPQIQSTGLIFGAPRKHQMQPSFPLGHISCGSHSPSSPNLPPMLGLFIPDPKPKRYPLLVQGALIPSNK